jgi:uncharacterized protein involved in outer membrane biogenesis
MWGRIVKIALSLPFLIVAGLFGLYLVFGFFLVNPLAQQLLPWIGENKFASQLSAQQVKFNPLTLEVTVDGLKLAEKSGAPLAGFDRLYVNLDTTGLFRWAWRIRAIELDGPRAILEIRRGGKLNWATLIAKLKEDQAPPSDTIARVLIDRIKIANGDIDYSDANRAGEPFKVSLQPLGIELDGLSTLPEDRGDYLIAAKLPEHGGTLKWKGDVGLNPIASSGELGLEGVRLTNLLRVIKSPRNFEVPSGTLAAGLRYRFTVVRNKAVVADQAGEDVPWLQVSGANLIVQNLALAHRSNGARALELAEARVSNANFDLATRRVDVAGMSLSGGKLAASRDIQGTLDLQTLFSAAANGAVPQPASPKSAVPTAPWKIDVREIKLSDWSAHFNDQGFAKPLSATAEGFGLTAALKGEMGTTTAIEVGLVNAELGPIRMLSGAELVAELQRVGLVNAALSLAENRMAIEAVELNGFKTTVTLDKQKNLNWTDILKKAPGAPEGPPGKPEAATAAPMDVQLARLSLDGIEVGIVDQSPEKPVRLDIVEGFVTLKDLSLDMVKAVPLKELEIQRKGDVPLEAGFALKQGGRLDARGTLALAKRAGRLDLKLAGLSLKPFAPYVNQFARLNLHSGAASTRGRLVFTRAPSGLKLDYDGGFAVDDLAITEEETEESFLGWKRLSSDSLAFNLGPGRLHINELVAQNPFGKIIIFEDKSINLQRVLRKPAADGKPAVGSTPSEEGAKPAGPEKPAAPAKSAEPPAFPLAIERLRIVGANTEFADLSLTPQFGTRMHDLGGVVTGLSNDPATTPQRPRRWNSTARLTTTARRAYAARSSRSGPPNSPTSN